MTNNWIEEFAKQFTDGCDKENGYYDAEFTTLRPSNVIDFITTLLENRGRNLKNK